MKDHIFSLDNDLTILYKNNNFTYEMVEKITEMGPCQLTDKYFPNNEFPNNKF